MQLDGGVGYLLGGASKARLSYPRDFNLAALYS